MIGCKISLVNFYDAYYLQHQITCSNTVELKKIDLKHLNIYIKPPRDRKYGFLN